MKLKLFITAALVLGAATISAQPLKVSINPGDEKQTIEYFAAADAWSGDVVGKYWSETAKQKIADWLFSQE